MAASDPADSRRAPTSPRPQETQHPESGHPAAAEVGADEVTPAPEGEHPAAPGEGSTSHAQSHTWWHEDHPDDSVT